MSKTIEEVGLIVGGIALALLAGPVGIGFFQSLQAMNAMIGIGLTTALSGVGLALRPKPTTPIAGQSALSFTQGPSPRRVAYGRTQAAGVLTYVSFPAGENLATTSEYLHLVYTLTGHEISSFDAVVIDGTIYNFGTDIQWSVADQRWVIVPLASGSYNDFYWQHMFFEFDFGRNSNAQPFPSLAFHDQTWTSACIQQNCAKVHVVLRSDSGWTALFPGGQQPNIQFLITGKKLIDPRVQTAWQASTSYSKYQWFLDTRGILWVQTNSSGTSSATRPNFEGAGTGWPVTVADNTLSWTTQGQSATQIEQGTDGSPQGHLVNGRLVNDSWAAGAGYAQNSVIEAPLGYYQQQTSASGTTGTTEPAFNTTLGGTTTDGTQAWVCLGRSRHAINPSNSALVVFDYLQNSDWGMAAPLATIDQTSVIAAANVCEEQTLIIWNADNSVVYENLYACDGMFDQSSTRGNVLTALCGSMAGWVIPPGDLWHVFAGSYVTPTIGLGDGDMRAPIKGDFRLSRRDVANSIKGTYVPGYLPPNPTAAANLQQAPPSWQTSSFPAYQANGLAGKPNYILEDGGQILWQDLQLDFTKSLWMAQRLAKIALMRLRFQQTLTLPCKLTALTLEAGDTFSFTHSRWGILAQSFLAEQCSVVLDNSNKDAPAIAIDLVARQTYASVYTFTPPSSSTNFGEYSPWGITGVMTGVE
jgi:hypothetical protein